MIKGWNQSVTLKRHDRIVIVTLYRAMNWNAKHEIWNDLHGNIDINKRETGMSDTRASTKKAGRFEAELRFDESVLVLKLIPYDTAFEEHVTTVDLPSTGTIDLSYVRDRIADLFAQLYFHPGVKIND